MPTAFPTLTPATDVASVVERIDLIVDWSIANACRLGYFAALYKRITRAIGTAVANGDFHDGPRMERLDATFANRYFAALNGYFNPAHFPAPSHCWRVALDAAMQPSRVIVLHMLAGVNAHIDLDLGIATHAAAQPGPIAGIAADFTTVNNVLGAQVKTVIDEINTISPVLAALADVAVTYEIGTIDESLIVFRDSAWNFAMLLAAVPGILDGPTIGMRDLGVAQFGSMLLNPPRPLGSIVDAVARQESADVARNVQVLDGIASAAIADPQAAPSSASKATATS